MYSLSEHASTNRATPIRSFCQMKRSKQYLTSMAHVSLMHGVLSTRERAEPGALRAGKEAVHGGWLHFKEHSGCRLQQ